MTGKNCFLTELFIYSFHALTESVTLYLVFAHVQKYIPKYNS